MPATWRLAALVTLVVALPLQAQHREHQSAADEFNNAASRIDTTVALGPGRHRGPVQLQRRRHREHLGSRRGQDSRDEPGPPAPGSSSSRVSLAENPYRGSYDDDDENHMGFELTVPRSARMLVRSVSGDLRLRDVSDIELHTVSGDIQISNIANRAILETVAGDVTATKVGGGLRVNTVSGDIHATDVTGEVTGQSVSGDIKLDGVTSSFVRTETVSGEIQFTGPIDTKGRYEFHSHSGDIDLNLTSGGNDATLYVET